MKISLVIPVYNEEGHLQEFLEKVDKLSFSIEKELVIIDDCSKDNSYSIISGFSFQTPVVIYKQEKNRGKGAAIRKGFELSTGNFIAVQDADFEYDMEELPKLFQPLIEQKADVVYGSRFKKGVHQVHRTFHYLVNRILTIISNILSGLYLSDMETCYKLFRSDIIRNLILKSDRFGFEPEVTAKIARLKVRVMEFPISYYPRNYIEGKKITWKDGIAALYHIVYFNKFQSNKKCFKETLPEKYIPKGKQWL
jgi:glycosyltransferase involved in cell wall biosynthesis